MLGNSRTKLPA